MTFFEAALEVLRTAQRPLDYKTITQFAVNRHLLGHVGHTPDIVMASCLIRAVQRCETGALIRLETGEFALRGWGEEILSRAEEASLPESVSTVEFPPVNVGLLDEREAVLMLEDDDIQFRKSVQLKFERNAFGCEEVEASCLEDAALPPTSGDKLKSDLILQENEHFNLCAAIVKILRQSGTPMRSAAIVAELSAKMGTSVYEHSVILAMRADNALRVSRGKRAVFMHMPPDLWTLTETCISSHVLKLESKIYNASRQIRICSLHALTSKLRELSVHAWVQLAVLVMKHLNYTIISQCKDGDNAYLFRAEESRGLTYVPVVIKVIHASLVETQDVENFRKQIQDLGYEHGMLMTNADFSRDALNECMTRETPIYAYSARQIAPIMFDARIGVTPHDLPIVFIDNDFFDSLSTKASKKESVDSVDFADGVDIESEIQNQDLEREEIYDEIDTKVGSGEFLFGADMQKISESPSES